MTEEQRILDEARAQGLLVVSNTGRMNDATIYAIRWAIRETARWCAVRVDGKLIHDAFPEAFDDEA